MKVEIFYITSRVKAKTEINEFLKQKKLTTENIFKITQSEGSYGHSDDFSSCTTLCIWYMEESK